MEAGRIKVAANADHQNFRRQIDAHPPVQSAFTL